DYYCLIWHGNAWLF
nr:immunoglobulin light chain junction region [Macaca mulatta]MOY08561.1 immunoglobulin light chain junction region [Macaca mulatta]